MMGTLFVKECRQILRSLIYYLYLVIFILDMTTQMGDTEWVGELEEPAPGQEYYGYGTTTEEAAVRENAIENLFEETYRNAYYTYPFGFIKIVALNDTELVKIKEKLETCTGKSFEELEQLYEEYWEAYFGGADSGYDAYMQYELDWHIPIREDYTQAEFLELMEEITEIVGKGCYYESRYQYCAIEKLTYEDAYRQWQELCEKDRVTGAAMRLFCDYAGIILAILPVFLGVSACLRDKRAKMSDVVYAKPVSGVTLILSRYLANVAMIFVPVALYAFLLQMPYQYEAVKMGMNPDVLAFLKYNVLWNLPIIMAVTALSFLITEAFENILAIPLLLAWAFASIYGGASTLEGNFGLTLVTRWNAFGGYGAFMAQFSELCRNKAFYFALSAAAVLLTIIVYEKKRREGISLYGKIRKKHG